MILLQNEQETLYSHLYLSPPQGMTSSEFREDA